jgi:hypothetical protein
MNTMMSVNLCSTKKDLRARVGQTVGPGFFVETSLFGPEYKGDGAYCVAGPSPDVRKWFAQVEVRGGKIVKVT